MWCPHALGLSQASEVVMRRNAERSWASWFKLAAVGLCWLGLSPNAWGQAELLPPVDSPDQVPVREGNAQPVTQPKEQAPMGLTLQGSIAWALSNSPELAAIRQQRGVAAASIVISKTYP